MGLGELLKCVKIGRTPFYLDWLASKGRTETAMPFDPAIRQIIASFRQSPRWNEDLDLRLLQAFWPKLVGEPLAGSTSVVDVRGSRIIVRVPDETWKQQLISLRGWILRKVNEPWPNRWITDIEFTHEDKRN